MASTGVTLLSRVSRPALVLGIFLLLAVAHTWPLALRPAVYSRVDNGDYCLNVWVVDWVAHTLPTNPAHLFDANIFYPSRLALAYSEPLILQGVLAIPGTWMGLSPIATFNLVLIAGFALSGWAFALLVHRYTGSWMAGVVAGSAVAFNAHQLVRLAHIQALHLELVPLVFLALDRLLETGRRRFAAFVGAAVALQGIVSIYLLVFTTWAALCAAIARIAEWRRRLRGAATAGLLAAASFAVVLLPVIWPYAVLARTQGMVRGLGETRRCAASWTDYLYTGSRLHFEAWSHRFADSSDAGFPGVVVTALAIAALWFAHRGSPRVRMWVAVVVGSVSFCAPTLPGLRVAARTRGRARRDSLLLAGIPDGAGRHGRARGARGRAVAGDAGLCARRDHRRHRAGGGGKPRGGSRAVLVSEVRRHPSLYDRLRDEPHAVVVELPFFDRRSFFGNAEYMIYATRHRHPLVNGYSGFAPADYNRNARAMRAFPALRRARADASAWRHPRGRPHDERPRAAPAGSMPVPGCGWSPSRMGSRSTASCSLEFQLTPRSRSQKSDRGSAPLLRRAEVIVCALRGEAPAPVDGAKRVPRPRPDSGSAKDARTRRDSFGVVERDAHHLRPIRLRVRDLSDLASRKRLRAEKVQECGEVRWSRTRGQIDGAPLALDALARDAERADAPRADRGLHGPTRQQADAETRADHLHDGLGQPHARHASRRDAGRREDVLQREAVVGIRRVEHQVLLREVLWLDPRAARQPV